MEIMPLYTYSCSKCNSTHELSIKMEERDNSITCPDCNNNLSRKIDRPGLVWAPTRGGSGFAT